eukprot:CCRYP_000469-RA/>CCRYP_000469-RA protein AED:0.13 eAED:0.13 QI:0/0.8/0.83/1/0/0/6/1931/61
MRHMQSWNPVDHIGLSLGIGKHLCSSGLIIASMMKSSQQASDTLLHFIGILTGNGVSLHLE